MKFALDQGQFQEPGALRRVFVFMGVFIGEKN